MRATAIPFPVLEEMGSGLPVIHRQDADDLNDDEFEESFYIDLF